MEGPNVEWCDSVILGVNNLYKEIRDLTDQVKYLRCEIDKLERRIYVVECSYLRF